MPTYFGNQTQTGDDDFSGAVVWSYVAWACPGSGNQTLVELSGYLKGNGGNMTGDALRLAIYNSTGTTLIAQGSASFQVSGTSYAWQGHMSAAALKPAGGNAGDPITLTGGTTYLLAIAQDYLGNAGKVYCGYNSPGGTNVSYKANTNYAANGFPSSTPTPDGTDVINYCIRGGVNAASETITVDKWQQLTQQPLIIKSEVVAY